MQQINELLKDKAVQVRRMASDRTLVDFLETVKTRDDIISNPAYFQLNDYLDQILQSSSSISAAWFASEEGSYFILNNNVISLPDYDIKSRPWHEKALKSDAASSVSDPYVDVVTGKLSIDILQKVIVEDKVIGFTSVSMFIDFLPSIMSKYHVGRTGYTFLMAKDGTILYHPDRDLVMESWQDHFGQSSLNDMQRGMSLVDIDGGNEYVVAAPVPLTDWIIGSAMPESEALEQLKVFTKISLLFYIGSGFMVVLLVSLLLNYMLKNIPLIIKQLHLISEGQLSDALTFDSPDELGKIAKAIHTMSHKLHSSMQMIHESAYYDPLTGLPNRRFLSEKLASALQEANRRNENIALFFIDLDDFKMINDTRGHKFGDELLCQVGSRLMLNNHEELMVFRFGGDEFVIILEHVKSEQETRDYAEKLRDAFTAPFELFTQMFNVNFSAGIVMFPNDGVNEEELLKNSDTAMYSAKSLGKNTVQFFNADMIAALIEKEKLTMALRQAVTAQSFTIHYQAIVDAGHNRLYGFEALLRWMHPELGMISPEQFIPLAEELGLIVPIGEWVLNEASKVCQSMQSDDPITMSVNVSALQLRSPKFIDTVNQALQQSGLAPHLLVLEITEGMVIEDFEQSVDMLQQLRALGVRLALDDFGTGYSSFSYLKNLPIDILKIDKSFIQDLKSDLIQKTNIVGSIIHLVQNLGMKVTAEGVETEEQANMLRTYGCDFVQGYWYSKPIPIDLLEELWDSLMEKQIEM